MKRKGFNNNVQNLGGRMSIISNYISHYERLKKIKNRRKAEPRHSYRSMKRKSRPRSSQKKFFLDFEPLRSYSMRKGRPKSARLRRSGYTPRSSRYTPRSSSRSRSARYRYTPRGSYSSRSNYSTSRTKRSSSVGRMGSGRRSLGATPRSSRVSRGGRRKTFAPLPELDEHDKELMESFVGMLMKFKTTEAESVLHHVRKKVLETKLRSRSSVEL